MHGGLPLCKFLKSRCIHRVAANPEILDLREAIPDWFYPASYQHENQSLEYISFYNRGGSKCSGNGLTTDLDKESIEYFNASNSLWNQNPFSPRSVAQFIPDGLQKDDDNSSFLFGPAVTLDRDNDVSMPANASIFATIQLTSNNDFWTPLCGRLTYELGEQSACTKEAHASNWTSIVKYYGTSLPDSHGTTEDLTAHISVEVLNSVESTIAMFASQCELWFSQLADFGAVSIVTKQATNVTLEDGTPVFWNDDPSNGPVQDPSYLMGATTGGWRAIRTNDTSMFRLTIMVL